MIELDKEDRRQSVRLEFITDVVVRSRQDNRIINGTLENLGIGGLALKLGNAEVIDSGTDCVVDISIRDRNSELVIHDVEGRVVRTNGEEIAIQFDHRFEWLAIFHVYHSKSAQR